MGIGKRIKEARLAQKLTQEELARKIGVTKGAIANYELGTSHPKEQILYKLFGALGVDANYLFQDVAVFDQKPGVILTASETELIHRYRLLPAYLQETVSYLVDRALIAPSRKTAMGFQAEESQLSDSAANISVLHPELETSPDQIGISTASAQASDSALSEKQKAELHSEKPRSTRKASILRFYPYLNYAASAGSGSYIDDIPTERIEAPYKEHADFIIGVSGASMEPDYQDGDLLYVEKTDSLNCGEVGIFSKDGSLLVKEVGKNRLISRNHAFPDIYPESGEIFTVGRVLGKVKR